MNQRFNPEVNILKSFISIEIAVSVVNDYNLYSSGICEVRFKTKGHPYIRIQAIGTRKMNIASLIVKPSSSIVIRSIPMPKPPCGGHPIFKEFQIKAYILSKPFFLSLSFQNFIPVFTLRASGNLHASPNEVVSLGNALFITHMIKSPLFRTEIRYKQEFMIVFFLHPLKAEPFRLRCQIPFLRFFYRITEFLF